MRVIARLRAGAGFLDPLLEGMTETSIDGGTLIDDGILIDGVNSFVHKVQGLVLEGGEVDREYQQQC